MWIMYLLIGIAMIVLSAVVIIYALADSKNKNQYMNEATSYPIYHWKFLRVYWAPLLLGTSIVLICLGFSTIYFALFLF